MLQEETCFIGDAIGIDPSGCGCVDCQTGSSIPVDQTRLITELVRAHFEEGRRIVYRNGAGIVVYRSKDGEYKWVELMSDAPAEYEVISPEDQHHDYAAGEGTVVVEGHAWGEESVGVENQGDMARLVERRFTMDEIIINRTDSTLLIYRTLIGVYSHVSISTDDKDPQLTLIVD